MSIIVYSIIVYKLKMHGQLSWLIVMELRQLEHFAAVAAEGQFNPGGYAA